MTALHFLDRSKAILEYNISSCILLIVKCTMLLDQ